MGQLDLTSVRDSSDQLVKSVHCYNPRSLYLHGYIAPFVSAYFFLFYIWFGYYSSDPQYTDYYFVSVGVLVFIQILVYLSSLWSVHCQAFLAFNKVCLSFSPIESFSLVHFSKGIKRDQCSFRESMSHSKQWLARTCPIISHQNCRQRDYLVHVSENKICLRLW